VTLAAAAPLGVVHSSPGFALPDGACDCHVHVFEPERHPFSPGRSYTPATASIADLTGFLATLGLSRVVLVQPSPYGADNALLLEALRSLGRRARAVAVIDAATTDGDLRAWDRLGVRGARLNLESSGQADARGVREALAMTAGRIAELGWHVQIHARLQVLAALEATLLALPTQVVVDHFGYAAAALGPEQPHLDTLLRLLGSGKAYVKLSAAQRIGPADDGQAARPLARRLIAANPDRILWGSDWPHTGAWPHLPRRSDRIEPFHPVDDGLALQRLAGWVQTFALRDRILVANPERLYRFETEPP